LAEVRNPVDTTISKLGLAEVRNIDTQLGIWFD
jgi:hypothetical protein